MNVHEFEIFLRLIMNKGFRDWVINPNEERNYFWRKWMAEHPDATNVVKKAREFVDRISFKHEQLSDDEKEALLGKIIASEKHQFKGSRTSDFYSNVRWWMKVVAVLVLCFGLILLTDDFTSRIQIKPERFLNECKIIQTGKGQRHKEILPDGTTVYLNAESTLQFPLHFNAAIRRVELKGEAFFEVVRIDTVPFIVSAQGIETQVFGTSFNVRAVEEELATEVSLVSGKVSVDVAGNKEGIGGSVLKPGEQFSYNWHLGKSEKHTFDIQEITAWKDGIIYLKDASLDDFIVKMENWYGVDFQVFGKASKEWRINGRYQNEELDNILKGLMFVYGISYKIDGDNVMLIVNQ
ncbi:FecR family protein [Parapedobacter koreensis]|uniref:FecR family protein n=1 Tax=Parapedobacter koreensis TaxID=332977 RepID=A0A1H7L2J8_9SPHI|nr:FecR domain-containing protein [Parapedobacter koreensis]SEK93020.1 FecR family protein [Parapedobacter koreensis]